MPKVIKFEIIQPNSEKQTFTNAKDACNFLGIKSYAILYNIINKKTTFKHSSNQHLNGYVVNRINKKERNDNNYQKEHKTNYVNVLNSLIK
jgi:hypothetical protein